MAEDYLSFINTPYFWVIAIIVGILIVVIWLLGKYKKDEFKGKQAFIDIVQREVKSIVNTFGYTANAKLYHGIHEIGKVIKYANVISNPKIRKMPNKTEVMETIVTNPETATFYLLSCRKLGLINSLKALIGFGVFFILIQRELITVREKKMYIDNTLRFDEFGKVWVLANPGNVAIIENLYWKDNYETSLGELAEYPRKIAYLETMLGKDIEKMDKTIEAIDSSKKSKMRKFF